MFANNRNRYFFKRLKIRSGLENLHCDRQSQFSKVWPWFDTGRVNLDPLFQTKFIGKLKPWHRGGGGQHFRAIIDYQALLFSYYVKGALYIIQILCRRYTCWSYPAGLTIADSSGCRRDNKSWSIAEYIGLHHFHTTIAESIHTTPNSIQCPFKSFHIILLIFHLSYLYSIVRLYLFCYHFWIFFIFLHIF